MRPDKVKVYTLEIMLLAILSFTLFVSKIYSRIILACLLTLCTIATSSILKKRNVQLRNVKQVNVLMIIFAIIYLVGFYFMGWHFGYYKPIIRFSYTTMIQYIIPMAIVIISSEMMRNILLAQNAKLTKALTYIIMVAIDLMLYIGMYKMETYDEIIEIVGFTLFASLSCNLFYNYVSVRYGFVGNIIFRLITVLYAYIIPVIPNVIVFFRSILRIIYPYIMYLVLEYAFGSNRKAVPAEIKRNGIISKVILGIIITIIAMIISCQFTYGVIIVATGSMTGTINKGDAVLFEKYDPETHVIEEGQIIIFEKDLVKVIHRVIEVKNVNGEKRYYTKGDANQNQDDGYRTQGDIYAISKLRIPYIGYPTILIRDILK